MTAYRVTRDENRATVGPWTADLKKGQVLKEGKFRNQVPKEVAEYLMAHDLLIKADDKAEDNPWYDSESAELSGVTSTQSFGPTGKLHEMSTTPEN